MKTLELHYPMIQFSVNRNITRKIVCRVPQLPLSPDKQSYIRNGHLEKNCILQLVVRNPLLSSGWYIYLPQSCTSFSAFGFDIACFVRFLLPTLLILSSFASV